MAVTPLGMMMLVKPTQSSNVYQSMVVTLSGMVILVKPVQPENAAKPMVVTPLGMVMLVKPEQLLNALLPMLVPPVITTVFRDSGTWLSLALPLKMYSKCVLLVPSFVFPTHGNVMLSRLLQNLNAPRPMLVTLSGMVTLVKLEPQKAYILMLVMPSGMIRSVSNLLFRYKSPPDSRNGLASELP